MKRKEIWEAVVLELRSAKKQHPNWPDHVCGQACIVLEEAGELARAAVNYKYDRAPIAEERHAQILEMREEAIQLIATTIRFLENLKFEKDGDVTDKQDSTGELQGLAENAAG